MQRVALEADRGEEAGKRQGKRARGSGNLLGQCSGETHVKEHVAGLDKASAGRRAVGVELCDLEGARRGMGCEREPDAGLLSHLLWGRAKFKRSLTVTGPASCCPRLCLMGDGKDAKDSARSE